MVRRLMFLLHLLLLSAIAHFYSFGPLRAHPSLALSVTPSLARTRASLSLGALKVCVIYCTIHIFPPKRIALEEFRGGNGDVL